MFPRKCAVRSALELMPQDRINEIVGDRAILTRASEAGPDRKVHPAS